MKKARPNGPANRANPAKERARIAKVVAVKPSFKKSARRAAFSKASGHLSVANAISQAKLIAEVDPVQFRIIHMPG
ncbi:MAG: hypothetical protein Q7S51_07895 [Gallionellaceae bacterium]|nr:hypothetical protein [Gallionellaceae bacterium]